MTNELSLSKALEIEIEQMESQFTCLNCENPVVVKPEADKVQCQDCGHWYKLAGHLCPQCLTYYEESKAICRECGESTTRLCPNCNAPNWPGADDCIQCGVSLDILEYMVQHTPQGHQERLRGHMQSASYFKAVEEKGSRERMAELMAIEEERQQELNRQRISQRRQERKMLLYFLIAVATVLLSMILFTVLT